MDQRFLAALLVLSVMAGVAASEMDRSDSTDVERVIVIDADTLRADRLGVYGHDRDTSPSIDRFAEKSVVFEEASANSVWTLTSDTSVMTGTYPRTHRVFDQRDEVPRRLTTMAEAFREEGYSTSAFVGDPVLLERASFAQGFQKVESYQVNGTGDNFDKNFDRAVNWMNESQERQFVFIHGYDLHASYEPQKPYRDRYDSNYSGPADHFLGRREFFLTDLIYSRNGTYYYNKSVNETVELDQDDIDHIRAEYDASVRQFDSSFGSFISDLKKRGMYEDSVIVLTSSHGETLGEHQYGGGETGYPFGHRYLYETNLDVPMIVKAPGAEPERISRPVSHVDIAPTIYEITGLKVSGSLERQLQGSNMLEQSDDELSQYSFSQVSSEDIAVVGNRTKLIVREGKPNLMTRITGDSEVLIPAENNKELREDLEKAAAKWRAETPTSVDELLESDSLRQELAKALGLETGVDERLEEYGFVTYLDHSVESVSRTDSSDPARINIESTARDSDADFTVYQGVEQEYAEKYLDERMFSARERFTGTAPYTDRAGGGSCPGYIVPNTTRQRNYLEIDQYRFSNSGEALCSEFKPSGKQLIRLRYCPETGNLAVGTLTHDLDSEKSFSINCG